MQFPLTPLSKLAFSLCCLLSISCTAMSQPTPAAEPSVEGKAIAEKVIRPNKAMVAIVLNEKGEPLVVDHEGKPLAPCQVCTPELESRYGPKCTRARQASTAASLSSDTSKSAPLICNKLMDTNIQAVNPVSVVRHTGSNCMTVFVNAGGQMMAFQYCY